MTSPFTSRLLIKPFLQFARCGPTQIRFISDSTKKIIQQAVNKDPLVLFMKGTPDFPQCGFSRAVVQVLQLQGVDFNKVKTYNILEDQELREGIKEFSNWPTIPQVYIKGEFVGGCDIVVEMHQNGELEQLLEKEKLVLPDDEATLKENITQKYEARKETKTKKEE